MWPLLEQPVRPTQEEVEYSNLVSARAQLPSQGPRATIEASPRGVAASREGSEGIHAVSLGQGHVGHGASVDFAKGGCPCSWG